MVIVTFSTMYKSHLVLLKEQQKVVNHFHDINTETEIECIWRSQSIIQVTIVFVIKTICINLILKPTLIAFKCVTLLIIMLVDSFYFLETIQKITSILFYFLIWLLFQAICIWLGLIFIWGFRMLWGRDCFQWNWQQWMLKWQSTLVVINSSPWSFFLLSSR